MHAEDMVGVAPCAVCQGDSTELPAGAYNYLFGQYLGDGHLVTTSRVPVLRIDACPDYPSVVDEIVTCVEDLRGTRPGLVRRRNSARVITVQSYWTHWPCLLPQHGPGYKHTRSVHLASWQQQLVAIDPWAFIRGLVHSDGCRALNRVRVKGREYRYPRYFFANESTDILEIAGWALDLVGVEWRFNRRNSISVARRTAVRRMDEHIGPKT